MKGSTLEGRASRLRARAGSAPYLLATCLALCLLALFSAQSASAQDAPESPDAGAPRALEPEPSPPGPASSAERDPRALTPPRLLHFEQAPYPAEARSQALSGEVLLVLTVGVDGSVSNAEVMQPAGHGFDEAAMAAAKLFRFEPAQAGGVPVAAKIPFRYAFTLEPPPQPEQAQPGALSGQVRARSTDEPLPGARISVVAPLGEQSLATADADGNFRLGDLPAGTYHLTLSAPGFSGIEADEQVLAGQLTELVYRLPAEAAILEVSVVGTRPPREVTRRTLERREMTRIPGASGDALRSLQSLPGVARPPLLAGLLIVRGSAPEDTEVFVDGATVPLIYHFGGLSSAVPTELLERIDFYPGNFSAKYGRVMGGIVDVGLRSPNTRCTDDAGQPLNTGDCFHGLAQVDLIDARLLLQGPLPFQGWSFAVGARRSWVDTWLKPVLREAGASVTTAPVYYDYQLIAEGKPTAHSKLSLRLFGSDDRLEILIESPAAQDPGALGGNLSLGTSFLRAQALFDAELTPGIDLRAMLSAGHDSIGFSLGRFLFDLELYPISARSELSWRIMQGLRLNAGLDFAVVPFHTVVRLPEPPRPGEPSPGPFTTRPLLESETQSTAFRPSWYLEAELRPSARLSLTPGVRLDYARDSGHGDFSPRLTARYELTPSAPGGDAPALRTTLKGGAGVFHQPPQFQETDAVFGTPGLYSNRSFHYSLGVERELSRQVELSVEGFYKDLTRVVSRTAGENGSFAYANEGQGYAVGAEALLKYKADERFFGWVAYTLSRSVRQDTPDDEPHLFQYDQTHILTLLGSYKLGRGWEAGARFRLVSGPLDTPARRFPSLPAVYAADAAAYTPLSSPPFSERLPLFHQLDVRVEKNWQLRAFRLTFFVDLLNVYNNAALEAFTYNFDYSQRQYQQGLPIIPSLGFRGEF